MISYEIDGFTQPIQKDVHGELDFANGIHFTTWSAVTAKHEVEISKCTTIEKIPFQIQISKFIDEDMADTEIVCDAYAFPTLEEAKAFVEGWIAATESED